MVLAATSCLMEFLSDRSDRSDKSDDQGAKKHTELSHRCAERFFSILERGNIFTPGSHVYK